MSKPRVVVAGLGDSGLLSAVHLARARQVGEVVGISAKTALVSGQELGVRLARPDDWARDYFIGFDRFRGLDGVRTVHGNLLGLDPAARSVSVEDADGATHLDALLESTRLMALGVDVAIGSRAASGSDTAARHSRLRESGARRYRALTGRIVPGISDTQCGFKVFRGDVARTAFAGLRTAGFSFDVELLARVQRSGARVVEFPVQWADVPGSTFEPLRHGAGAFLNLAVIAWQLRVVPAGVSGVEASLAPSSALSQLAAEA